MLAPDTNSVVDALERAMIYYQAAYDNFPEENRVYPLTNVIELSAILDLSGRYKNRDVTTKFEPNQYVPKTTDGKRKLKNPLKHKLYANAKAQQDLKKEKEEWESKKDEAKMEYWTMLSGLNIDMCLLMVNHQNQKEDEEWMKLENDFKKIWALAGSEGNKLAELEHLQILIYALSKVYDEKLIKLLPPRSQATIEDLSAHIAALREALTNLRTSLRKTTTRTGRSKK